MAVFHGAVLDVGDTAGSLRVLHSHWLRVDSQGFVDYLSDTPPPGLAPEDDTVVRLGPDRLLIPGFIDTHIHAAQVQYTGTGTDLPLMEWLTRYAFPAERRLCSDLDHAESVYTGLVDTLLNNGTTAALYFGVLGVESSLLLARVAHDKGQRAFVGKVSMNRLAPDDYVETAAQGTADAERFVLGVRELSSVAEGGAGPLPLVEPAITPRFVPCCTEPFLQQLGDLAAKHHCLIQSHAVESVDCLATVASLHPDSDEVKILNAAGLLTDRSVMAHAVHITEPQAKVFQATGTAISHCPLSNFYFAGACLRTSALLDRGIKVGLGSDVAGGYSPRMLDAIRHTVTTHLAVASADAIAQATSPSPEHERPSGAAVRDNAVRDNAVAPGAGGPVARMDLDYKHAVWLATAGGAAALGLEGRVGRLRVGYAFDASVVNLAMFADPDPGRTPEAGWLTRFERFVHLGDDRNFDQVWVQGKQVRGGPL